MARTVDAGASWHLAPVPSPSSGQAAAGLQLALMPRVIYDRADGIYRMWYAEIEDPTALVPDACKTNLGYATSEDGLFWSGAWWGYGFHEDGARSGLDVARLIEAGARA